MCHSPPPWAPCQGSTRQVLSSVRLPSHAGISWDQYRVRNFWGTGGIPRRALRETMVEQGRTQLFMMLVQQAGAGALTLCNLSGEQLLPFFRQIEEQVVFHGLSPVIVYWSTQQVRWLLPENGAFTKLRRDGFCISTFAEERLDKQDEFCFLVHSQGISMVIYGHCSDENSEERIYQCVGSIDPNIVKRAFGVMLPVWQFVDLPESNRLEDARSHVGMPVTAPHFVAGIRNDWGMIKQRQAVGEGVQLAGSDMSHPQMVVRPGAEPVYNQGALDLNATMTGSPTPNIPPPPPGMQIAGGRTTSVQVPGAPLGNSPQPGSHGPAVQVPGASVANNVPPPPPGPPPGLPAGVSSFSFQQVADPNGDGNSAPLHPGAPGSARNALNGSHPHNQSSPANVSPGNTSPLIQPTSGPKIPVGPGLTNAASIKAAGVVSSMPDGQGAPSGPGNVNLAGVQNGAGSPAGTGMVNVGSSGAASATMSLQAVYEDEANSAHGDPSLLQEFDFQELTNSPHFKPPSDTAGGGARNVNLDPSGSNGGNGSGGGNGGNGKNGGAALTAAERKKEQNRGIRDLREAWTNITQEVKTVFAPDAQKIIRDIVSQLRLSSDLPAILQLATEELTKLSRADRGLIWQVVDDRLVVTNEFAQDGHNCFGGSNLGAQESTAIVSEFLSRFPDETGSNVIGIPDTMEDAKLRRMSPTLAALIELGDARARLVAQIRCRGMFHGFIELQQCKNPRDWSEQDGNVLQSVSEVLSLVVQQSFDLGRIEQDAGEMKLVNEISTIFRESGGQRAQYTIEQSIKLLAEHSGFNSAQIFLFSDIDHMLVPQISEKEHSENIPMAHKNNPFMQVFESGKLKTVNLEYSKRADQFFGHDTAMIIPLMSEGERLGVLGIWRRKQGSPMLRPQDRDLAFTVAGNLASFIRADQAIARIRQDRSRASLINTVSEQIQQSLKEVKPILQTLTGQLVDYFDLELCTVSIFDPNQEVFTDSQCNGPYFASQEELSTKVAEHLFQVYKVDLESGAIPMLRPEDVRGALGSEFTAELPEAMQMTMLFPLRQGNAIKGALCIMSSKEKPPLLEDMNMIQDLLARVAVVIAHKELFEQVERQAITDPLTGLYNRRFFEEQLNKELERAQRFGHSCSYIILDLDHFKSVNDTLDHGNGDIALKHTAAIVRKCVRDVDTVGRFGGEEFVVLLPESDFKAAKVVADRICNSIRESVIEQFRSDDCVERIQQKLRDGKVDEAKANRLMNGKITASVGVSTFPMDSQDKTRLMELADKYLYLAKGRGRNQVCSSQSAQESDFDEAQAEANKPEIKATPAVAEATAAAQVAATAGQLSAANAAHDLQVIAEHGILGVLGNVIKTVGARDGYNDERSPRAADYATKIALTLRLGKDHCTIISLAAILNNLGKVMIDEQILRKAGPLTAEEWKQVEGAPQVAAKILEPAKHLHRVATVVESYQEHWDGSGYPRGIAGEDIPLESRIIAIVDAFVAMTSDRPWRKALSKQEAIANLQKGSGKDWDPRIVKLFLSILEKENAAPPQAKPK